ncbi:hypothetical protein INN71_09120 [Nocardioides sp. ChNu-153]|uniref:hypothetical protein n=1 Tax=unclassified Nocardioides TaxID=2615069 RepID=UPI00240725C0|nr:MULTISPECIES: hypothetical protein [unclassified Nocardioides]MDF9717004.1 hypothetical protein [Nocardioides sp. ChNu-99]MDN7121548.1 hypothetical protein [Nocardioides sp. ChNu-153]
MKITLAILSGLTFLAAAFVFALTFEQLNSDLDAETESECVTLVPPPGGATTQRCDGTEEAGGLIPLAILGGSLAVVGSALLLASVNVRHRDERRPYASVPGPGGPPWNPPGR